eukprot:scaffold75564_cov33-Prasinocladus_malaysianus.AAC.1
MMLCIALVATSATHCVSSREYAALSAWWTTRTSTGGVAYQLMSICTSRPNLATIQSLTSLSD